MSQFDPATFLSATTTEVNEKRPLLLTDNPADSNGCYLAMIGEPEMKNGEKDGRPWYQVVVPLKIEVPAEQQALGIPPQLTVTLRGFLDVTEDGSGLDNGKGKNTFQRLIRDATGLNNPGQPFNWLMLTGKPVKVKVHHREYNSNWYEDVKPAMIFKA